MPLSCSEVPVTTILHLRAISGKRASKLLTGTIHLIYRLAAPAVCGLYGRWLCRIPVSVPPMSKTALYAFNSGTEAASSYLLEPIKALRRTGVRAITHSITDKDMFMDLMLAMFHSGTYGRGYAMFLWAGDMPGALDGLYTDCSERTMSELLRSARTRQAVAALTGAVIFDYVDPSREVPDGVFTSAVSQYLAPDAELSTAVRRTGLLYDTVRLLGHGLSKAIHESLGGLWPPRALEATALTDVLRNQSLHAFHGVLSYSDTNEPTLDVSVYNFWEHFILVMKAHLQTEGPVFSTIPHDNVTVCSDLGVSERVLQRQYTCWSFQGDPIVWPGNTTDLSFVTFLRCPGGLFADPVRRRCEACSAGSYSRADDGGLLHSATGCDACAPGSAQRKIEATSCGLCPPGTFSPRNGSAQCTACTSGFFAGAGAERPRQLTEWSAFPVHLPDLPHISRLVANTRARAHTRAPNTHTHTCTSTQAFSHSVSTYATSRPLGCSLRDIALRPVHRDCWTCAPCVRRIPPTSCRR